ncbi:class I SAM-dependent methyltransferase [Arcobacter sp. s6]|uniref:class I SAM-dependent methyltransferase n=1 Tax=Arcobacter sp. s6 TaxID=3230363 RepID=UPI0034A0A1C8
MENFNFVEYVKMVKTYQENNDPTGWFDTIYKSANGDHTKVFWADLEASPYLVSWLENNPIDKISKRACVVGCGVGDDAEALSEFGFEVIAFDISPTAIELCKNRYQNTKVNYVVADLFDYPKEWFESFDVVYECNTIQVLPGEYRVKARASMSSLICKDGYILVSCRSRNEGEKENAIPLPLTKAEMDKFVDSDKLKEISFLAYDDIQEPPVPHFFGIYKKI